MSAAPVDCLGVGTEGKRFLVENIILPNAEVVFQCMGTALIYQKFLLPDQFLHGIKPNVNNEWYLTETIRRDALVWLLGTANNKMLTSHSSWTFLIRYKLITRGPLIAKINWLLFIRSQV